MSSFTLKIETDNDAFEDQDELTRILRDLANDIENGDLRDNGYVHDINGNRVGTYDVVED